LVERRAPRIADQLAPEVWATRHASVQRAIDTLAEALALADADIVVIIGNDQEEIFPPGMVPPIAVWCAATAEDDPPDLATLPEFRVASQWAFHGDNRTTYPCRDDLARHLVEYLCAADFDVATVSEPPPGRYIGHAYTFIQRRVIRGSTLAMVPIHVNSFYPQSQPTVERCVRLGAAIGEAIEAWPVNERVAVVASGGLSHTLVDEEFDRGFLTALASPSLDELLALPNAPFTDDGPCGTGESKNWIAMAVAARGAGLQMDLIAYEHLYRTSAGTGVGAAFARWT
jgi:hypothetical protein